MLAIHAIWALDHRLHLWAEDAAAFEAHRRRNARRTPKAPPHPWAAPADRVARAIEAETAGGAEVTAVDLTADDQIVAVCRRGRDLLRVALLELPMPDQRPGGAEWVDAYRHWARPR